MIALDDVFRRAGEIGDFPRSLVDLIGVRNALADRYAANDSARAAKHSFLERIGERGHPCRIRFAVNSPAGQKAARRHSGNTHRGISRFGLCAGLQ